MDGVVPKVTAFDETSALWRIMRSEPGQAREIIESMTGSERAEFERHLSDLMDIIWSLT